MKKLLTTCLAALVLFGCTSIDCTMNNQVLTKYKLAGDVATLTDTLTISTTRSDGSDSVLLNRLTSVDSLMLPMSYQHAVDEFVFDYADTLGIRTLDTIKVHKKDIPHFESIDCTPTYFHEIEQVECTHHRIDSIVINNPKVNYNSEKAHFLIYFKTADY